MYANRWADARSRNSFGQRETMRRLTVRDATAEVAAAAAVGDAAPAYAAARDAEVEWQLARTREVLTIEEN